MTTNEPAECPKCRSMAFKRHCQSGSCHWHVCGHCGVVYDDKGHQMNGKSDDRI